MNEKILHIANGLNDQYPSPDVPVDTAWTDMQKLMDDDDDTAIVPPPIPPAGGNNGYWKYGLLLLLITGIAVYYASTKNKTQQVEKVNSADQKIDEKRNGSEQSINDRNTLQHEDSSYPEKSFTRQQQDKDDSLRSNIILPGTASKFDKIIEKRAESAYTVDNTTSTGANKNIAVRKKEYTTSSKIRIKLSEGAIGENDVNKAEGVNQTKRKINGRQKIVTKEVVVNSPETKRQKIPGNNNQEILEDNLNIDDKTTPGSGTINKSTESFVTNDSIAAGSSIKSLQHDPTAFNKQDSIKTQLLIADKPIEKTVTDSTKGNKKAHKKITWAAGLGLNKSFAIGRQQYSGYNANGHKNIIADYIPAPFIRISLDKKLSLQLEAQFNTPQYTKQQLIKKEIIIDSNGNKENATYINKLYYFNLPLSIHYSVSNNFNIGAGLQFSQLTNAVGLFEVKQPGISGTDTKTTYTNLKNDPLYKEIKTTEWRLLLDANYQWKDVTFGARYSQALSNFITVPLSPTQLTKAKNSSVQLFVWYTLWKHKK